LRDEEETEPS